MLPMHGLSSGGFRSSANASIAGDDELASDVDEPPDKWLQFAKLKSPSAKRLSEGLQQDRTWASPPNCDRKESLLTQGLLSSPEMQPISDNEAPTLTSEGGLTSPARSTTPSPPLDTVHASSRLAACSESQCQSPERVAGAVGVAPMRPDDIYPETNVEASLGRKRCISFACGRQSTSQKNHEISEKTQVVNDGPAKAMNPTKRPCMLKFACPLKPSRGNSQSTGRRGKSPSPIKRKALASEVKCDNIIPVANALRHRNSDSTAKNSPPKPASIPLPAAGFKKGIVFNRIDFQKSEATRFHEFACHFNAIDEWTNEQTAYRQKITVNDTLRKENAIRKLAEEAEEEALEEEAEEDRAEEDVDDDDDLIEDRGAYLSDDGNETDDEEGFADSDDESEDGSDYQFWTPGLTTAATSTDHLDHFRPSVHAITSDSSIDSTTYVGKNGSPQISADIVTTSTRMRPGTPELPDSSDFIVGTVDEDRPLEEAYISCRRSKHNPLPQDIDPSFPTSEPERENDEDEESEEREVEVQGFSSVAEVGQRTVQSRPASENGDPLPSCQQMPLNQIRKPRNLSPKRLISPPPKNISLRRSPPPRHLFGQVSHRLRSPPPMHRKLHSPPSSRRSSVSGSPPRISMGINVPHLAQRPNLTHTTSLPKTPNPFWIRQHRSHFCCPDSPSTGTSPKSMSTKPVDGHSRGPIDIVQGLETKRQRRKDKFWRQQCRAAGKDKHRRCQPGKGAERMKELGLEMADRFRGYGHRAQLVLSI